MNRDVVDPAAVDMAERIHETFEMDREELTVLRWSNAGVDTAHCASRPDPSASHGGAALRHRDARQPCSSVVRSSRCRGSAWDNVARPPPSPTKEGMSWRALRLALEPCRSPDRGLLSISLFAASSALAAICRTGRTTTRMQASRRGRGVSPVSTTCSAPDAVTRPTTRARGGRTRTGSVRRRGVRLLPHVPRAKRRLQHPQPHQGRASGRGAVPGDRRIQLPADRGVDAWSVHSWAPQSTPTGSATPGTRPLERPRHRREELRHVHPRRVAGRLPGSSLLWGLNWDSAPDPMHFQYVTDY